MEKKMIKKKIVFLYSVIATFIIIMPVRGISINETEASLHPLSLSSMDTNEQPVITITVDYIAGIDPIDIGSDPDWYYIIKVYKSTTDFSDINAQKIRIDNVDNENKWDVDKSHDFTPYHYETPIDIYLKDRDTTKDDTADISGKLGEKPSDENGKIFTIIYNVDRDEIISRSGEKKWTEDGDYIILNGESDGRGIPGPDEDDPKEDDAMMRIKIEDNINQFSTTMTIDKEKPWKIKPDDEVTFICTVQGGAPPFTYRLYPWGYYGAVYKEIVTEDRTLNIDFSYGAGYHGHYLPYLWVNDSLGSDATFEMKENIVVNNPPHRPEKPKYSRDPLGYTTSAYDPDNDVLYYKWWYDGKETEWECKRTTLYVEELCQEVKVKVRDDPNRDGNIDDGFESDWSESCFSKKSTEKDIVQDPYRVPLLRAMKIKIISYIFFKMYFK